MRRLESKQIARFWEQLILPAIVNSSVGNIDESLILKLALDGLIQCYIIDGLNNKVQGLCITSIREDEIARSRTLFIEFIIGFSFVDDSLWEQVGNSLIEIAKENKCNSVSGVTKSDRLIGLAEKYGWDTSAKLLIRRI